jgi:hypothetical protein
VNVAAWVRAVRAGFEPFRPEPGDASAANPTGDEPSPGSAARAPRRTLGSVRIPSAVGIALGGCAAAFALLLYLGRDHDFYFDEWDFVIHAPDWTLRDYFVPHNEHWSTLPMLSYRVLIGIFGMGSYTPFRIAVLLLHVTAAFVLFLIVRRKAGDLLGIAAAALLLVASQGAENIFWAFQVGFVGSILFGLVAIYLLLDPPRNRLRPAVASGALVASLACSGVGIFFLPTVAVDLVLDRARRRLLWVLGAPVVAYGVYFLTFGRRNATVHRSPLEADLLRELATYVPVGVGRGLAGMLSLGAHFSMVALAAGAAGFALLLARVRPLPTLAIGAAVGLVAQYTVIGMVRAQFGDQQAMASRYIYIATVLGLLIFTAALAQLPFTGLWRPATAVVLVGLLVHDVVLLAREAEERATLMAGQEVRLQTAWLLRDAPGFDPTGVPDQVRAPTLTAGAYVQARTELGTQYPERTIADVASWPGPEVDAAVRAVLPPEVIVTATPPAQGECAELDPAAPSREVEVTDGTRVWFTSTSTFPVSLEIRDWMLGGPTEVAQELQTVEPGQTVIITIPDSGRDLVRRLQVTSPVGTAGMVCWSPTS